MTTVYGLLLPTCDTIKIFIFAETDLIFIVFCFSCLCVQSFGTFYSICYV